jgi:LPXTG-site transpeptidase (sortase) family protein
VGGLLLGFGLLFMFGRRAGAPRRDPSPTAAIADEAPGVAPGDANGRRSWLLPVGNFLIAIGAVVVLGTAAIYAYAFYLERQARSDPWLAEVTAAWDERASSAGAEPEALPAVSGGEVAAPSPEAADAAAPLATATASPTAAPRAYPPPVGIRIPAIDVDSRVVEVGINNGEYEVPKFYVGHYRETANPGEIGNGVYTGHVESLESGNVFAGLGQIEPDDEVFLYTSEGAWIYRIVETKVVRNDDLSVMAPSPDRRITLITCAGTFDVGTRQYTHRFIATGKLVNEGKPLRAGTGAPP